MFHRLGRVGPPDDDLVDILLLQLLQQCFPYLFPISDQSALVIRQSINGHHYCIEKWLGIPPLSIHWNSKGFSFKDTTGNPKAFRESVSKLLNFRWHQIFGQLHVAVENISD